MQSQEQDEGDNIELYLRVLRKKVEHQLKNPFQLAFSNYTFEELFNWKNNVLQLDATSRLYGQRVDFLHSGALHILGSVVNLEQKSPREGNQLKSENRKELQKQMSIENVFIKHLQNPNRLNGGIFSSDSNFLEWREIMKKRDTLPLLMLNQLPISSSLMLHLISSAKKEPQVYQQVFKGEESVYLKMINFGLLESEKCRVFEDIRETVSEINSFLMTMGHLKQERQRGSFHLDQFMEFDFPLLSESKQIGLLSARISDRPQPSQFDDQFINNPDIRGVDSGSQMGSSESQNYDAFSFDTQSTQTIRPKKQKQKRGSRKQNDRKRDEYVEFSGLYPSRNDVLAVSEEKGDLFLSCPDYLHLKFIKYQYPFAVRPKHKGRRSLIRPSFNLTQNITSSPHLDPLDTTDPFQINSTLALHFSAGLSKKSQINFKEASLPLKMLKKKIREVEFERQINLWEVKAAFPTVDPLDIFISVLHIAAQDGLMVLK